MSFKFNLAVMHTEDGPGTERDHGQHTEGHAICDRQMLSFLRGQPHLHHPSGEPGIAPKVSRSSGSPSLCGRGRTSGGGGSARSLTVGSAGKQHRRRA